MSILPTREHLRTEHQMLVVCEKIILTEQFYQRRKCKVLFLIRLMDGVL